MRKSISGFTIVELLIVIVVIAILAAISIVAYNGIQTRANASASYSAASNIAKKIESYRSIKGMYPVTQAELNSLTESSIENSGVQIVSGVANAPASPSSVRLVTCASGNGARIQYHNYNTASQNAIDLGTITSCTTMTAN